MPKRGISPANFFSRVDVCENRSWRSEKSCLGSLFLLGLDLLRQDISASYNFWLQPSIMANQGHLTPRRNLFYVIGMGIPRPTAFSGPRDTAAQSNILSDVAASR